MHRNMFMPTLFTDKLVVYVVINNHQHAYTLSKNVGGVVSTRKVTTWSEKVRPADLH